jgi:hypothetical protein
VKNIDQP